MNVGRAIGTRAGIAVHCRRCLSVHAHCWWCQIEREKFRVYGLFLTVPVTVIRHLAKAAQRSFELMVAELERDADAGGSGGSVIGDEDGDDTAVRLHEPVSELS
jgi:hypothetical protein